MHNCERVWMRQKRDKDRQIETERDLARDREKQRQREKKRTILVLPFFTTWVPSGPSLIVCEKNGDKEGKARERERVRVGACVRACGCVRVGMNC